MVISNRSKYDQSCDIFTIFPGLWHTLSVHCHHNYQGQNVFIISRLLQPGGVHLIYGGTFFFLNKWITFKNLENSGEVCTVFWNLQDSIISLHFSKVYLAHLQIEFGFLFPALYAFRKLLEIWPGCQEAGGSRVL